MNSDTQPLIGTVVKENTEISQDTGYHSQQAENYVESNGVEGQPVLQAASKVPQYFAAITASLSALASGIVLGWTSPITSYLENGHYHNISIDSSQMGWIGAFVTLGGMIMCFPFGLICDRIGRKSALLSLIIPFSIGWSLIIWAQSLLMLYCGRFITGMAAGACCVGAPLYNTEIAQKEIRGSLGGYFQLMVTIGIFLAYVVGKYTSVTQYTYFCATVPFVFFILFVFQPESPLYNIKRLKLDIACDSLRRLRGSNYNIDPEIEDMKNTLSSYSQNSLSNWFEKRATRKAILIMFALMFLQQLSGVNAIIFYTSDIFQASGSKLDPQSAAIIVGAFQVIATFISSLIVEKLGRRVLLIISDFMMAVSTVCLGIFFTLKDHKLVSDEILNMLGLLPTISLCVFVVMFSVGLGPIPWSISGEIFTPDIKSIAASSAATFNWFLAFLITKFYLQLEDKVGVDVLFYVFSVVSFCGSLFCYIMVPETKGKTIEEVQRELEN